MFADDSILPGEQKSFDNDDGKTFFKSVKKEDLDNEQDLQFDNINVKLPKGVLSEDYSSV